MHSSSPWPQSADDRPAKTNHTSAGSLCVLIHRERGEIRGIRQPNGLASELFLANFALLVCWLADHSVVSDQSFLCVWHSGCAHIRLVSDSCPLLLFSRTTAPFSCPIMEDTWTWSPRWLSREMNWKDSRRKGKMKITSLNHALSESTFKNLHVWKVQPIRSHSCFGFRGSLDGKHGRD